MALSTPAQIKDRLLEMYDPEWHESVYRQMKYAFGESWDKNAGSTDAGTFPHFPDISIKNLAIGQSRRVLGAQFIGLSKVMYNDPEAEYQTLEPMEAEARKQFILKRWRDTNWSTEEQGAFMDGDAFGMGHLQHGLVRGPNGKQMITVRHSPTLLTLGDRSERNPSRWRSVCFVQYIPAEDALKAWGDKAVPHIADHYDGNQAAPVKSMRVFEYYDLGMGGSDPTYALIPGDLSNEPLKTSANDFGAKYGCLPHSTYIHFLAPGMRRPTGRVVMQMATQEAINEIEDYMRSVMVGGKGFDIGDPKHYEAQDIKAVRDGKGVRFVRRTTDRSIAGDWERVQPMSITADTLARLDYLERRFTEESGITDFDRGNLSSEKRTLGENQLADQRGQVQGSWSVRQMIAFREETFAKAAKNAAMYDKDETTIEFFGGQAPVNVASLPESMAEAFCSQECRPTISEESMTYMDSKAKMEMRRQQLESIFPYVQAGMFNPRWWAEEMAKAIGEKDFRKAIQIPEAASMGQDPMAMLGQLVGGSDAGTNMGPGMSGAVQPGFPGA